MVRPASRRSTCPAGRSPPTRTSSARRTPIRASIPPTSVPALVRRHQQRPPAGRPDRPAEGDDEPLVRADRGRRRGRLRRAAQRVRADEGDDRGRRGRRALRRPARLGKEVRPPRRQGARADQPVHPHAGRGAPGGRRIRRPEPDRRAHRRAQRDAAHERHRRARPRVPHRRAHAEGYFRVRDGLEAAIARGLAYAPYADLVWCETSTPDLERGAALRRRDPRAVPGEAARLQLFAVVQLAAATSTTRIASSSASSAAIGYRFQFITLAGFHALNLSMFELARGYRADGNDRVRRAAGARVRARGDRLHRHPAPARGRRRLLRPGRAGRHRRLSPRRSRSPARPRRSSSQGKERRMSSSTSRAREAVLPRRASVPLHATAADRHARRGRSLHVPGALRARPRERLRPLARATFVLDAGPVDTGDVLTEAAIEFLTDLDASSARAGRTCSLARAGASAGSRTASCPTSSRTQRAVRGGDWRVAPSPRRSPTVASRSPAPSTGRW